MITAAKAVNAALIATKAPLTRENPANIAAWAEWFQFKTFQDPQLENMVAEAAMFVLDMKSKREPRWLTMAGSSGAGKTYLAKKIYRWAKGQFQTAMQGGEFAYPTDLIYWPEAAVALQERLEPDDVHHAPTTQFLVIDEVGSSHDTSGYVANRLAVILGRREKKWTVITSNLTVEQIGERIDTRVASRLIRGNNRAVEVDVMDFALR